MHHRFLTISLVVLLIASACSGRVPAAQPSQPAQTTPGTPTSKVSTAQAQGNGTLTVFAAASLTDAFNEIGKSFEEAHPGVKVTFNYAGSQLLAQQIANGAPVDVFASANQSQMDAAVKSKRIEPSVVRDFVQNRLVVIYPSANPGKIQTLKDLSKPGLKIVLADKSVPVGQYALTFLDNTSKDSAFDTGYKNAVLNNVVSYEQDVKAVLAKVTLGEADAGIVYTTDLATDKAGKISGLDIPDSLNVIAVYPVAFLQDSPHLQLAQAFVDYLHSSESQKIFVKYGFIPANQ